MPTRSRTEMGKLSGVGWGMGVLLGIGCVRRAVGCWRVRYVACGGGIHGWKTGDRHEVSAVACLGLPVGTLVRKFESGTTFLNMSCLGWKTGDRHEVSAVNLSRVASRNSCAEIRVWHQFSEYVLSRLENWRQTRSFRSELVSVARELTCGNSSLAPVFRIEWRDRNEANCMLRCIWIGCLGR